MSLVFVYDITNEASYYKIRLWMEDLLPYTQAEKIGLVLLGNKCDMEPRIITEEMGNKIAEELKINYYETSALTGQGIKEAFEGLTRDIMKRRGVGEGNNEGGGITLKQEKKKKEKKNGDFC